MPYTICLDPGHGPGTVNGSPDGTYMEREFTWDMYRRISALLKQRGFTVVVTRAENQKPSLTERANVSNRARADLFLSLHSDAAGASGWSTAKGLTVLTSAGLETAPRNVAANALLTSFQNAGVYTRRLTYAPKLTVLAQTAAPACLIEYGFHTNQEDVSRLKDSGYRHTLAQATVNGVCSYFGVKTDKPTTGDRDVTATMRGECEMTEEQIQVLIQKALKVQESQVWNTLAEVPDWGKSTVEKLLKCKVISGTGEGIELSYEQLRLLVMNDRMGLYGS